MLHLSARLQLKRAAQAALGVKLIYQLHANIPSVELLPTGGSSADTYCFCAAEAAHRRGAVAPRRHTASA
jgi:hypothetical protein